MNYELSSFDRVVVYNKNYTIFLEKPISAKRLVRADIFKKSFKTTYKNVGITFKKPIELEEIKNINFDYIFNEVKPITEYGIRTKRQAKPFTKGQEADLKREFNKIYG